GALYSGVLHSHRPAQAVSRLSPEAVVETLARVRPEAKVQSLVPPRDPDDVYELRLKGDRRVYLDAYSGELLGERRTADHPLGFLFALHTKLLSGENGEQVVGIGGLLLVLLGATGVVLWWPGKQGFRKGFSVQWRASWKRVNFDLHRVTGAIVVTLLALIAVTGAAMVWSSQVTEWTYRAFGMKPPRKPTAKAAPGSRPLSLDELLARADAALPGAVTTRITLASKPTAPVAFRKKFPAELHPNGTSFVYLDQHTGAVLQVENALEARTPSRLLNLRYPLHIGRFGGWPVRVAYVLVGRALPARLRRRQIGCRGTGSPSSARACSSGRGTRGGCRGVRAPSGHRSRRSRRRTSCPPLPQRSLVQNGFQRTAAPVVDRVDRPPGRTGTGPLSACSHARCSAPRSGPCRCSPGLRRGAGGAPGSTAPLPPRRRS
ncbi:MAG: PepSY-associated helix domain protein, partial [Armatimonadetes bacterium]|nr:PepSY-associated helix domain protein [Armatimonadota bacterium]